MSQRGLTPARFRVPAILASLLVALATMAGAAPAREDPALAPAEIMPLAIRSLLLDLAGQDELILAVGERGHILLSEDGGANFEQVPAPVRSTLTAVAWLPDRTAIAVGHAGTVLKSEPGGRDWRIVHFAPDEQRPLLDVWFDDQDRGIAVGAYGWLMRTRDGGQSWTSRTIDPDEPHVNELAQGAGGSLYAAAEFGLVFRSDDPGSTFERLDLPYDGSFFTVLATEPAMFVAGIQGRVYRSRDGGASWERIETGTRAGLQSSTRLQDGRVLLAGQEGALLLGDAGVGEFRLLQDPARLGIAALLQTDAGVLLAGEGGLRRMTEIGVPSSIEPVPLDQGS